MGLSQSTPLTSEDIDELLYNKDLEHRDVSKQYIKQYYDNKIWWTNIYQWMFGFFLLLAIGLSGFLIYEIQANKANSNSGSSNGNLLNYRYNAATNYSNPIYRLYNFAPAYINNSEIANGLQQALHLQLSEDVPNIWGVTASVVFNASYTSIVVDGTWPVILLDRNLNVGLAYHTVAQGPTYDPNFAPNIPMNIPYSVIEIPAECPTGTSHSDCLQNISGATSHELLEALINPFVSKGVTWLTAGNTNQDLPYLIITDAEIADAAQGMYYIKGNYTQFHVQNFVTPDWYDQLSVATPNVVYDFLNVFTQPGQVAPGGYIPYQNMSDGCQYYYIPSGDQTKHLRQVQTCDYYNCLCRYTAGTVVGADPINFSFANVYSSALSQQMQQKLVRSILGSHVG